MNNKPGHIRPPELLGYITGGIAHDLNNFLSPILLGVQTLQRNDPDEKTKRILSMIELSSRRAADLIRHLLDYSRQNIAQDSRVSSETLKQTVRRCCEKMENSVSLDDSAVPNHCELDIDETVLGVMIQALVQNAFDAISSEGRVQVRVGEMTVTDEYKKSHRTARSGEYLSVAVSDNGEGISEDILKHITEPFYTTRKDRGQAGLGLFFVHTMLKHHDGFLEVESHPGRTTIQIFLPYHKVSQD